MNKDYKDRIDRVIEYIGQNSNQKLWDIGQTNKDLLRKIIIL